MKYANIFFGKNHDFGYLLLNWMIPLLNTCHNMKTPNIRVRYLPCFQMGKFVFSFPLTILYDVLYRMHDMFEIMSMLFGILQSKIKLINAKIVWFHPF
jgi:hypothetical protein